MGSQPPRSGAGAGGGALPRPITLGAGARHAIGRPLAFGGPAHHARSVGPAPVLAHLALTLQARDRHADADDAPKL